LAADGVTGHSVPTTTITPAIMIPPYPNNGGTVTVGYNYD